MVVSNCKWCGVEIIKRGTKPGVFCSIDCKAQWQLTQKPVEREWLFQKYIIEQMSANEIAVIVNRNPKRVWEWLREYGIETRKRGTTGTRFQPGQPSPFKGKRHTDETREKIRLARIKDGRVPYLKNGVHHMKGKRGAETSNWKGGVTPERQGFYSTPEWKEAVIAVWRRDNAVCQRCGLDYRTVNRENVRFAIHHIVSFADKSKRGDVENLVLLCPQCHRFVHSKANINREFLK